ncbi:hypothetical protein, partial [Collinsella aerofaciens]|uniref:hypothetical protein n=1 Tax=Collinsella aerofaciens TaxID=74426 RepID=UPI0034A39C81
VDLARKRREHALWRRPTNERQIGQLTPSKARTRQREQGALKDEIATEMRLPMTRKNSKTASAESIWPERGGSTPYGGDRRMSAKSAS